jgi:trigger factor
LKITTEDLGQRQILLTIEMDNERVEKALRVAARRISREYSIPGFRRGRAPYRVVAQRFGREVLLKESLDDLGQDAYTEALEREGIEPYQAGSLEDVQLDPLVFKMRVPLRPVVDLGDYRELRIDPPDVTVDNEEVDAELEKLRQANIILEPVEDRAAEMGDWVSLVVSAQVDEESIIQEEDHNLVLDPEDNTFGAGFSEQITGMEVGDEKEFMLALSEDWGEDVAGQEAEFAVTLETIQNRILPDLDDDLARTVGDFDTLEELRREIYEEFEEEAERQAEQQYTEDVLQALVEQATIEYPPEMVEEQIDRLLEDVERDLDSRGLSLENYFQLSGQSEEDLRDSFRTQAERTLERGLALGELASEERLDVEGEEVDQRVALLSQSWGDQAAEAQQILSSPEGLRSIATNLLTDKAVQRLVAIAKGEAPPLEMPEEAPSDTEEEALESESEGMGAAGAEADASEVQSDAVEATATSEPAVETKEAAETESGEAASEEEVESS